MMVCRKGIHMKRFTFLLVFLGFVSCAFAQGVDRGSKRDSDSKDMDALRRWIQDKRLVTMKEIGGDLSLSGEVRTEFQATKEDKKGKAQRGRGLAMKPMYAWDVEFNLMLDYRAERSWAAIKLEFDNDMGQVSGATNKIRLERAYLGGRLIAGDTFTWDAEIGRRFLVTTFDSKIEFGAMYDGLLLRFSDVYPSVADCYANLGGFIINDRTNHYGFVGEIGALRIANIGLNAKYSLIDWTKPGGETLPGGTALENKIMKLRYRFLVSQALVSYQFFPEWFYKKLIKFYAAGLINHLALSNPLAKLGVKGQKFGKQNVGWYAGVSLGTVKKMMDWAVDMNFQWVQAQAVPSYDQNGIGRGNTAGSGLYATLNDGKGTPTTKKTATGNGNYYGFEINGLYAFTDNLTINPNVQASWRLKHDLGPNLIFKQAEVEFIYAF